MTDSYTPTETLILEVLIARRRLGEHLWPFDRNAASTKAADSLASRGLIHKMSGNVEHTFRASLTEAGYAEFMDPNYRPPIIDGWADYFEHWGSTVGSPPFTQEVAVMALRGPTPFGKASIK